MYTKNDFDDYVQSKRGTGKTMKMIHRIVDYVNEDPENNVPEISLLNQNEAKEIIPLLKDLGIEKFDVILTDGSRLFGFETTATFFHHTVAEYNLRNALSIYEIQMKDSI